jgi:hypothetical protein
MSYYLCHGCGDMVNENIFPSSPTTDSEGMICPKCLANDEGEDTSISDIEREFLRYQRLLVQRMVKQYEAGKG